MLTIEISADEFPDVTDEVRLRQAVESILRDAEVSEGEISIAVVSDDEMQRLNRQYLNHDYPTDVLSFVLARDGASLEGEIIVSAEYATKEAQRYGWQAADELLLYVIHGTLHLVGYDDLTSDAKQQMRTAERRYLEQFGLSPRYDEGD